MSPKKKPSVPPELSRDWLRRYEEFGDSFRKIGMDDGYDQRTVKSHIEKEQEQRDRNQARILFVKDSLEKHHQDLCDRAEELVSAIDNENIVNMDYSEDLYLNGLRQHLYRAVLWKKVNDWNDTLKKIEDTHKQFLESIRTEVMSIGNNTPEVNEAIVAVLVHQFEQWTRGNTGLNAENDWYIEERKETIITVRYGFSHFGWIDEKNLAGLQQAIRDYEEKIRDSSMFSECKAAIEKMRKLKQELRTELRGLIIRRVLPGKCPYCPV